jgi:hypothetical protein
MLRWNKEKLDQNGTTGIEELRVNITDITKDGEIVMNFS